MLLLFFSFTFSTFLFVVGRGSSSSSEEGERELGANAVVQVTVNASNTSSWSISPNLASIGIEYLNHEIYGGLYAQMVFGESFEEASGAYAPSKYSFNLVKSSNSKASLYLQVCADELYSANLSSSSNTSFQFIPRYPGLNEQGSSVSFESVQFLGSYLSIAHNDSSVENVRLGLANVDEQGFDPDLASFHLEKALTGQAGQVSLAGFADFSTYYIALDNRLEGSCDSLFAAPESDVILQNYPSEPELASWTLQPVYSPPRSL